MIRTEIILAVLVMASSASTSGSDAAVSLSAPAAVNASSSGRGAIDRNIQIESMVSGTLLQL
jgi:hypothetical protein